MDNEIIIVYGCTSNTKYTVKGYEPLICPKCHNQTANIRAWKLNCECGYQEFVKKRSE
jgi:hypothetical protein